MKHGDIEHGDVDHGNINKPLRGLDEWENDLLRRYPADSTSRRAADFRNYAAAEPEVEEFYRLNHTRQTFGFVQSKRTQFLAKRIRQMGVWQAMEFLNTLVDESDPDTSAPQIEHCLQTAEAIRRDGHPEWFIIAGLIHDLGKILCLFGEPQWAVVGDTFPVGCRFSDEIVHYDLFHENPDVHVAEYQTPLGVYSEGCGLDEVFMSWGHDEYLYHVVKDYLPEEALVMIRYHSFYAAHRHGAYDHLMNDRDRELFRWVRAFNPYDLYTKSAERPNLVELEPYYRELVGSFFPETIDW